MTVEVVGGAAPARRLEPSAARRDEILDFTKGALVVWMVVYHWLNYFVAVSGNFYRYLRPVTPSFIFITGFVVSSVYLHRYSRTDSRLHRRLFQRGAKLLLLFTGLNLLASAVLTRSHDGAGLGLGAGALIQGAFDIYVLGRGRAVFDVLVPIAYFLILAPVVLTASAVLRMPLIAIAVTGLVLATAMGVAGRSNSHVEFLSIAILGLAVGASSLDRIRRGLSRPLLVVFAYLVYLAAVTAWDVLFPLQVIGVCLTLMLIYLVGAHSSESKTFVRSQLVELGRYSLLAYIAQILVLQALRLGLAASDLGGPALLIPFAATMAATWASVRLTDRARGLSPAVDRAYRLVFA